MTALTAARATRLAREALNGTVTFTTTTGNDCLLTSVRTATDAAPTELRAALNQAAAYFRRFGYEATVITSGGTRGARVRYMVKVVDLAARQARIEEATQRRHEVMARELGYASVEEYLAAPGRAELIADPELSGYPVRDPETPEQREAFRRTARPVRTETTAESWGPDPVAVTREYDAAPARVLTADGEVHTAAPGPQGPTTSCGLTVQVLVTELPVTCADCAPVRRGPSREVVAAAVKRFQAELDAAAPAIARVLEEADADDAAQARARRDSARWAPEEVLPSGRYGVRRTTGYPYTGEGVPVVRVVQQVGGGSWGPTPGSWSAGTVANGGATLAIDYGAGWVLSEGDTRALRDFAERLLPRCSRPAEEACPVHRS